MGEEYDTSAAFVSEIPSSDLLGYGVMLMPDGINMFDNSFDVIDYKPISNGDSNSLSGVIEMENIQDFSNQLAHLNQYPEKEEFDTEHDFQIQLHGEESGKMSWVHSGKLNKVFIKMNTIFSFSIEYKSLGLETFLRAMIIYTNNDSLHCAVNRCPNHQNNLKPGETAGEAFHILRSPQPNAQLQGDPSGTIFRDRLCVYIPLSGSNQQQSKQDIRLEFTCQNSCSGINRRTTACIFTLEDQLGRILGRRIMHFKVCSCPKRDKEKEETDKDPRAPKKRKSDESASYQSKRPAKVVALQQIKVEPGETATGEVLTIRFPDKERAIAALKFIQGDIGREMEDIDDEQKLEIHQQCKLDIKKLLDGYKNNGE